MKKRLFVISVVFLIGVAGILIIIPMLRVDRTPGWGSDGYKFLCFVGDALQKYSSAHEGKTPPTLASLYPEYLGDKRVLEETPKFAGVRMALIYWHPQRLGSANTPVAQIVLDPSLKTDYPWRSFVLWGDLNVGLEHW